MLRELEGRSYGEIASILKLSTSAIETLIFRARRAFREQLEGSLTCSEAEGAISLQLDGRLERSQRGPLRAHLRSCPGCASLARRFRAQRSALRGLAVLPLPQSLAGGFGAGGGAAVGTALGVKAVAFGTAAIVAVGAGTTEIVRHVHAKSPPVRAPQAAGPAAPAATTPPAQLASAAEPATAPSASVQSSHVTAAPARTRHNTTTTTTTTAPTARAPTPAATPIATVTESSTAAPGHERGVRDKTAARRQPQPSGGGVPRHESNTREVHHGRLADPGSPSESNGRPDTPGSSDHSKSDDHPGQENGGGPPGDKKEPPGQKPDVSLPASEDTPGLAVPGVPGKPSDPPRQAERRRTAGQEALAVKSLSVKRRLLLLLVLGVALAAVPSIASGDSSRAGSNTTTFPDSTGEDVNAPDITNIVVSNDDAGMITFQVNIPNRPALTPDMFVLIFIDSDNNSTTGDDGAEYVIDLEPGQVGLFQWNGANYVQAASQASLTYSYASGATIHISAADLGKTKALAFAALAFSGFAIDANGNPDDTNLKRDTAPDPGHGMYIYRVLTKLVLKATAFTLAPRPAKAGRRSRSRWLRTRTTRTAR